MKQVTVRQARRELSEAKVKEWGYCDIVSDGKVIASLIPVFDVAQAITNKPSVAHTTKAKSPAVHTELKFSKSSQVSGKMHRA